MPSQKTLPCSWLGRCREDPDMLEICGRSFKPVSLPFLPVEHFLIILVRFWRIFWVDATTADTIELSLRDIAADPDAQAFRVERSAKSVLQWLSRVERDWLIVFDNATGAYDGVADYIPDGSAGNILFTSRNPNLARFVSAEDHIEVDNMEEGDAILLLLRSSGTDESSMQARQTARLIVKELCCLPLAVDQAGAAIQSGLCDLHDYLRSYSQHRQELLANPVFEGASNYGRAVYGSWDLSFAAIRMMGSRQAETAILILQIFAFFHHENIAEDMIKRAAEAWETPNEEASRNTSLRQLLHLDEQGSWDPFFFREGIHVLLSF